MNLTSIVIILQLALSLLSSVQSNPNLPDNIRQQAIDFSYQAIEMATDGIATLANPTANELGLASDEISSPCVANPTKTCKYPIAPTSTTQWINPSQTEYPQYHFTFNGIKISDRSRQFIDFDKNFTITWDTTQKNNNPLECHGTIEENDNLKTSFTETSGSMTKTFVKDPNRTGYQYKYFNINLSCKDNILGTGNSFSFQIVSN